MVQFKDLKRGSPSIKHQIATGLKVAVKHVDDSLFALSLRNPKLLKTYTKEIGNVHCKYAIYPMPKYRKVYRINNTRCLRP
jgi:hypothetical protein